MNKDKLVAEMLTAKAEKNNTINLDAYANGLADMFDSLVNLCNLPFVTNSTGNEEPKATKEKDFFDDIDKYEKQFYCNECGEDENFKYDRTVSNGEIWNCANCNTEMILNKKPNEDDY